MTAIRDKLAQFAIVWLVSTVFSVFIVITVSLRPDYATAQPIEPLSSQGLSNNFLFSGNCINKSMPSVWIGITATDVTEEIAKVLGLNHSAGALVIDVTPNSIAHKAGILGGDKTEYINGKSIKLGDVILEMDNQTVNDKHDLDIKLKKKEIDNSLKIKLFRDGKQETLNVSLPAMPKMRYGNHTIYRDSPNIHFLSYESIKLEIGIKHPFDWQIEENIIGQKIGQVLFRSNFENTSEFNMECLELSVSPISSETTDQILLSLETKNILKYGGTVVFNYTDSIQGKIKAMKIATIVNDTAYVISYFAQQSIFDDHFPTIQKMIDSFNILQISSYEDFSLGIKLKYPSSWRSIEDQVRFGNKPEVSFVHASDYASTNGLEGLKIIVDRPLEGESLDAAVSRRIKALEDTRGTSLYNDDELLNFNLNGNSTLTNLENIIPSYTLNYSFGNPEYGIIKTNEIITMKNNKLYYISYSAKEETFPKHLQIINDIIDSIRVFDTITYGNTNLGVTLQYPSGWIKDENLSAGYVSFAINNDEADELGFSEIFVKVDTNNGKSLKQIVDTELLDAEHKVNTLNLLENKTFEVKTSLDDYIEGHKIVLNYSKIPVDPVERAPVVYRQIRIYTNITDNLYIISYTARPEVYDAFSKSIEEIINSLKIIPPNSEILEGSFPNGSQIRSHPFKVNYPVAWDAQEFNSGVALSPFKGSQEYMEIRYYPADRIRLSELINSDFAFHKQMDKELITVASKLPDISGFSGTSVEFTYDYQGMSIRDRMVYLTHRNSDIYTIFYSADLNSYYKYLPIVEEITKSLKIEDDIEQSKINGFDADKTPAGIAINSDTNMLYVANTVDNTVSAIDGKTNKIVESIKVGIEPHDLAVNQETNTIYVVSLGSNEVTVIDGSNNTAIGHIPVGDSPVDIAVNQQKNMIYVADPSSNTVTVINGSNNKKIGDDISLGKDLSYDYKDGIGIALDEFTNTVYVTSESEIKVIDGNTMLIRENITDFNMRLLIDIAVDPIIGKIYAADIQLGKVFVIDIQTNEVAQIPTELSPNNIVVNPNTNLVYISNRLSDTITMVDPTNNYSPHPPIPMDKEPFGMAVNPQTNIIYATNYASKSISVIDGNTSKILYGVTLNINPSNSGQIECDGKQAVASTMVLLGSNSRCEAKANNGFALSSWAKDLDSNSNRTIITTQLRNTTEPGRLLGFISNIFPNSDERILTINEHGNFTANFIETEQMQIPREIWISLFGISISFIIPSVLRWYNGWRQRKNLRKFIEELPSKYNQLGMKELDVEITKSYTDGKINESQHKMLKEKASEYHNNKITRPGSPL